MLAITNVREAAKLVPPTAAAPSEAAFALAAAKLPFATTFVRRTVM